MELFERGVDESGARFLRAVGVRHVVAPASGPGTLALDGLTPAAEAGGDRVLEVTAGEAASVVGGGDPVATRFTPAGIVVVLKEARTIGRVVFELSDAPWIAHPVVEVSLDGVVWAPVEARASLADATLSLYRDPLRGRGEVRFTPQPVRLLRLDLRLPVRPGAFDVAP
jgi:hypothetical protein